ncbi:MAG: cell division protein FtsZ [Eubacteriales bacterium]|nr:cell division protein FtsZ [Eubacteriales bacterium]
MAEKFDSFDGNVIIKVIGIGGGGNNAVDRMIADSLANVDYININTDTQSLYRTAAPTKIAIGNKITRGQGAGSNPDLGKRSADESAEQIAGIIKGANMVFITAGMGGGTGTGAAPIIAKIAKGMGILTVAIVTKPFGFEGRHRMAQAESGIEALSQNVDSLLVIPNERLKLLTDKKITFMNAFQEADDILRKGVRSISELILNEGYINLDFADIAAVMTGAGLAHMGVGNAKGKDKAEQAAKMAMSSPLLETNISGAKGIIVNITASPDIGLDEIDQAATMITDEAHPDATVIFGTVFNPELEDEMKITLIATGFEKEEKKKAQAAPLFPSAQKPQVSSSNANASNNVNEKEFNEIFDLINKKRNV